MWWPVVFGKRSTAGHSLPCAVGNTVIYRGIGHVHSFYWSTKPACADEKRKWEEMQLPALTFSD